MFIQIVAYYLKIIGNSNYEYDITIDLFYLLLDKIPSACSKGDLIRKIFISEFPMYLLFCFFFVFLMNAIFTRDHIYATFLKVM